MIAFAVRYLPLALPPAALQDPAPPGGPGPLERLLTEDPARSAGALEVAILVAVLSLAPSILVLLTSFTRIVIVLSFVRRALTTPDLPPNAVVMGLALLLTAVVMSPTWAAIKRDALDPYLSPAAERIPRQEALRRSETHLRQFMFQHARAADVALFMEHTRQPAKPDGWTEDDVPTEALVPAFVISELRRAFVMGFALFLPFLIVDLVVGAVLVSMGLIMMPPVLVSLPLKVLLFVLVDGWHLVVGSLLRSFQT